MKTQLKRILTAIIAIGRIFTLPAPAAKVKDDKNNKGGINFIPALCVICLTAIITACGGGGGGGGGSASAPTNANMPIRLDVNSPLLGASHLEDSDGSYWFVVNTISNNNQYSPERITRPFVSPEIGISAVMSVTHILLPTTITLHEGVRFGFNTTGGSIIPRTVGNGNTLYLPNLRGQVFFETRPDITTFTQLCPAPWLRTYINDNFTNPSGMICPNTSGESFSPNISRVVVAAMADGFSPGFSFTDSLLGFFGRYDGDDRAAGFTYNFGNYALRTDYVRLPAKQDNNVWLDTYRLGVLHPINDEARFFAGIDNYKNAIFVLDTTGENLHRLGFAVGNGYAVKYEWRIDL